MSLFDLFSRDGEDTVQIDMEIDTVCELLRNERRRRTIRYVASVEGETTVGELTDVIATHEAGPEYTSDDRKSVYVSLYQNHLPKLHEAGALAFEKERTTVRGDSITSHLGQIIDHIEAHCAAASVEPPLEEVSV